MTDGTGTGAQSAGATAGAHNATVSIKDLEDALKVARQQLWEQEPDTLEAAAAAKVERAQEQLAAAKEGYAQAKKDADAMRKERAAAAEKENG